MKFSQFVFLAMLLVAGAFGCKQSDDLQDVEIISGDAEFAIPLFKARTSIQDLLENFDDYTFVEITPDGVIHLRYKGEVLSQTAAEFFDETKTKLPPLIPLDTTYFTLPFSAPDQLEVDFARYSQGQINMGVYSTYQGLLDITMTVVEATKNGQPLSIHRQVMAPVGISELLLDYDLSAFVDCTGYELQPVNGEVHISYVCVNSQGDIIPLEGIGLSNNNIDFSYIEGYLGNFNHKGKRDSISIEFFENWIQGDVYFENPVIQIHIDNSFGVPTRSSIEIFDIITADNQRIPLESDFITDTGIDFVYPSITEVGQTKSMTFTFDSSNSNIEDVLGARPIALDYKVNAIMNPDSLTDQRGFITDSSLYRIQIEVDLPLHGRASGFGVVDSFDLDFSDYDDLKEVEFKLVADNKMPLAIDAQAFFVDENGAVLDSLFDEITRLVEAAPVDSDGVVTESISKINFSTFDEARFDKIRKAKKLALHANFSTTNNGQQSVKAFADQDVEIRMGMKVKR